MNEQEPHGPGIDEPLGPEPTAVTREEFEALKQRVDELYRTVYPLERRST